MVVEQPDEVLVDTPQEGTANHHHIRILYIRARSIPIPLSSEGELFTLPRSNERRMKDDSSLDVVVPDLLKQSQGLPN